jgi:hypothetical protein
VTFNGDRRVDVGIIYHHTDGSITLHTALADSTGSVGESLAGSFSVTPADAWAGTPVPVAAGAETLESSASARSRVAATADPRPSAAQLLAHVFSSETAWARLPRGPHCQTGPASV